MATVSWLLSFLYSALAFVAILFPLVVFHEFGHFIFAKLFGVKAETFSVGFGPRLWGRQWGETEFRLSAIPLGGYVKLLGEDREAEISEADLKRALHKQAPWKRFFIFFGGPLFNFILAIFVFMVILVIGEPQVASGVGRVVHGSLAEKVGFQSGDQIVAIDQKPVKKYEEVLITLNESPGKTLTFSVIHPKAQTPVDLPVLVSQESGMNIFGEMTRVGEVDGLLAMARSNQVGISDPASLAAKAGLETGDKILQLNGKPIQNWEELEQEYQSIAVGTGVQFQFQKAKTQELKLFQAQKSSLEKSLGDAFGLFSSELFIEKAVANSPAEKAGIRSGDRIIGVGDQRVESFFQLKSAVQSLGEKEGKILVKWERQGVFFQSEVTPTGTSTRDPGLKKITQFTIGVVPLLSLAEPVTFVERVLNPFVLVGKATDRMVTMTLRNVISLGKMVTGNVSLGSLGGPITIGKIAGESLSRGLVTFLMNMALFSISLGILNILPVPVLDGGHLMLLAIESIRGKPLTLRQMEVVQGAGLIFILALMGIAFHNDITRLIYS